MQDRVMKYVQTLVVLMLVVSIACCHSGPTHTKRASGASYETGGWTQALFTGENLTGWETVGGPAKSWKVKEGVLFTTGEGVDWEKGKGGGWLSTTKTYDDFKLSLEFRMSNAGNSGVFLRAPRNGDPAFQGLEVQLLDDYADKFSDLDPAQYTGSVYSLAAPKKRVSKKAGKWQSLTITCKGSRVTVTLNGERIVDLDLEEKEHLADDHPGVTRRSGYIGLQNHNTKVSFRNIQITEF